MGLSGCTNWEDMIPAQEIVPILPAVLSVATAEEALDPDGYSLHSNLELYQDSCRCDEKMGAHIVSNIFVFEKEFGKIIVTEICDFAQGCIKPFLLQTPLKW